MQEQVGPKALARNLRRESERWAVLLPQLPRLGHAALKRASQPNSGEAQIEQLEALVRETRLTRRWLQALTILALGLLLALLMS
jgi:ubiquinone biosynthesis protein